MPFINRFTRLLSADLNALLDRIEEPDILLRQALREMSAELTAMRARAADVARLRERLARDIEALAQHRRRLDDELDLCLDAGAQALARNLVRRRLESERRQRVLDEQAITAARDADALADAIAAAEADLAALNMRLDAFEAMPGSTPLASAGDSPTVSEEEIDIALLAATRRRAAR